MLLILLSKGNMKENQKYLFCQSTGTVNNLEILCPLGLKLRSDFDKYILWQYLYCHINDMTCFRRGTALIRSSFCLCFGFGKTQIILLKYFKAFCSTVVFDEHFKGADTETSPSHVLISFISHINMSKEFRELCCLVNDERDQGIMPLRRERSAKAKGSVKDLRAFFREKERGG